MLRLLCQLFPKVTIKTIIKFNGQFELFPMQSNDSELLVKYSEPEFQENSEGPTYILCFTSLVSSTIPVCVGAPTDVNYVQVTLVQGTYVQVLFGLVRAGVWVGHMSRLHLSG